MSHPESRPNGDLRFQRTSFRGEEALPPLPAKIVSPIEDKKGLGISSRFNDHRSIKEGRRMPHTRVTVQLQEVPLIGDFGHVGWKKGDTSTNMLSTHPELVIDMVDQGPLALDKVIAEGEDVTVNTVHLQDAPKPHVESPHGLYIMQVDAKNGLFRMHDVIPVIAVDTATGIMDQPSLEKPENVYNLPNSATTMDGFIYQGLKIADQVPAVHDVFTNLGFSWQESLQVTRPAPTELVKRMDMLRETDTSSGLYYPELKVLPVGDIPPQGYLEAYAENKYPFAAKTFMHYDHDIPSHHLAAYMVYGEMAMDVSVQYSRAILESDYATFGYLPHLQGVPFEGEARLGHAAYVNDIFTTDLGNMDLHGEGRGFGVYANVHSDIVNTLKQSGRLGELKLVEWMQENGMVRDYMDMTGEDLLQGLLAQSRERLLQPQGV